MDRQQTQTESQELQELRDNPSVALGKLSAEHRPFLRKLVSLRMDRRLRSRIDPSDIIQTTFIEAATRLNEYLANPKVSMKKWLAYLAEQNTVGAYRTHLGTKKRSAEREEMGGRQHSNSGFKAIDLLHSDVTDPAISVARLERREQLFETLARLSDDDQTIVHLRFFLGMTHGEMAKKLGITENAAAQRSHRALKRLLDVAKDLGLEATVS